MDAGSFEGIDDNRRVARELCKPAPRCAISPGDPASTGCATCPGIVRQIASSLPPTIPRFSLRSSHFSFFCGPAREFIRPRPTAVLIDSDARAMLRQSEKRMSQLRRGMMTFRILLAASFPASKSSPFSSYHDKKKKKIGAFG